MQITPTQLVYDKMINIYHTIQKEFHHHNIWVCNFKHSSNISIDRQIDKCIHLNKLKEKFSQQSKTWRKKDKFSTLKASYILSIHFICYRQVMKKDFFYSQRHSQKNKENKKKEKGKFVYRGIKKNPNKKEIFLI